MREWGAVAEKLVLFVRITFGEREKERKYSFFFVQHLLKKNLKGQFDVICLIFQPTSPPASYIGAQYGPRVWDKQIYLRPFENLMIPSHY
jgi:hypothetical protein